MTGAVSRNLHTGRIMNLLGDDTPLANILMILAFVGVGVGFWYLLWGLVALLPAKLRRFLDKWLTPDGFH